MKKYSKIIVLFLIFLLVSCSSSHSPNDSDMIADSDCHTDSDDLTLIEDDDSDTQETEIVDDSDELSDADSEETSDGIFEKTQPINGYKRCYDKIPAGDYEGWFANPYIESEVKRSLGCSSGLKEKSPLRLVIR